MMKNIISSPAEKICPRCGSKQRISKVWKEKIPTLSGFTEVEFSQIMCTNEECQKAFDKNRKAEEAKKKLANEKKAAHEVARTNNIRIATKKVQEAKSTKKPTKKTKAPVKAKKKVSVKAKKKARK